MAAHPRLDFSSVEPYERVIPPSRQARRRPKEFRFTLAQLIVSWSICAGLMAATFFFGLFAGKERGMQLALEEQARLALRVPLPERAEPEAGPLGKALIESTEQVPAAAQPAGSASPAEPEQLAALPAEAVSAPTAESAAAAQRVPQETIGERVARSQAASSAPAEAPKLAPRRGVENPPAAPKAKTEVKTTVKLPAVGGAISSGYYVQVAAKRSPEAARDYAQKLVQAKYSVSIEEAKVGGKQFYRVLVGPYNNAKAAKSRQKLLVGAGLSPKNAFVKRVS